MKLSKKQCERCEVKFIPNSTGQRFCSKPCSCRYVSETRKKRTPPLQEGVDFFWEHVVKGGNKKDCWNWTGKKWGSGYGRVWVQGVSWYLHRFSYLLHFGEIPDGLYVCHKCDNPICANPKHLFLGTSKDNTDDMWEKGRANPPRKGFRKGVPHSTPEKMRGELNGNSKLTESQVRDIKRQYRRTSYKVSNTNELAKKYGVTANCILHAVKGKRWPDVR